MSRGNLWDAVGGVFYIGTGDVAIGANDFACGRIPNENLLARFLHKVKLVDVACLACATAGSSERNFAQTPYLAHGVWCIVGIYHINLIAGFVGVPEKPLWCELFLYQIWIYGLYYIFHYFTFYGVPWHTPCCISVQLQLRLEAR